MNFTTKEELSAICAEAEKRANAEANQESCAAAYLCGYAAALKEVLAAFEPYAIHNAYEHQCRREDAEAHIADYFDLTPDDPEDKVKQPNSYQECAEAMGAPYEELCDPDSENFVLDDLVERFEKAQDCELADNDVWRNIIFDWVNGL